MVDLRGYGVYFDLLADGNVYGMRKSPQSDKPDFSLINLVFLKKPYFSGERPGLSEIIPVFLRQTWFFSRSTRFFSRKQDGIRNSQIFSN